MSLIPDYTSPFPIKGPVTYAIAAYLLHVIVEEGLSVQSSLPIAISLVDNSASVNNNLKRTTERRLKSCKHPDELNCVIESLYAADTGDVGPDCQKLGINKAWLDSNDEFSSPSSQTITNRAVLELFTHLRKTNQTWEKARIWTDRIFPKCGVLNIPLQTLSTSWTRIRDQASRFRYNSTKKGKTFLDAEYNLPSAREVPTHAGIPTSLQPDVYHQEYASPVKQKLVEHIKKQDEEIQDYLTQMECIRKDFPNQTF